MARRYSLVKALSRPTDTTDVTAASPTDTVDPTDRFDAPIRYRDVRKGFNTSRALGASAVAFGAIFALAAGHSPAPWALAAGLVVAFDGIYRRTHGESALPLLLVDATAIGVSLLARGPTPAVAAAAFIYLVTAGLLLLPLQRVLGLIIYTMIWAGLVAAFSPLAGDELGSDAAVIAGEVATTLIFIGIICQLLFSAGRSLHAAVERQRAALESERRASQLKDEFVSMVSHELRTPLTSIAGFTDTLRESWPKLRPEEIDEFLLIMRREAAHLGNLVEDILVIPRLEAGHLRLDAADLDLRSEAFRTGQLVFQDTDQEFAVAIPGGVMVHADQVRLEQVLRNLLENARKYGGDQVLVEGDAQGDLYRVIVSDNGPGVPEAHHDLIFEHFEQVTKGDARSDQGVGLGLPIARTLARAMGGDLWYEPRFPIGSQFCFTIQLAQATMTGDATPIDDVKPHPAA